MKRIVKYPALLILSITFLYAACDDGITPPPYDGPWEKVPIPASLSYPTSLWFTGPNDGWVAAYNAVGSYDGNEWKVFKDFSVEEENYILEDLYVLSPKDIWISGEIKRSQTDYNAIIIHYDGVEWEYLEFKDMINVGALWMFSDRTGWGGGDRLLYFNGETWEDYGPYYSVQGFYFHSKNDGWMVTLTHIYHWDGVEWTEVLKTRDTWLYDIDFAAPDDGWAVGFLESYHYDGTEWKLYDPLYRKDFSAVHFLNENFGWGGFSRTYFYDGETWTEVDDGNGPAGYGYYNFFCVSEDDVWGCGPTGEGYFMHFTGFD
jgi:hypothetical protein